MGYQHVLRVEGLVEFLLRHQPLLEHDIINTTVGLKCLLGHLGRGLVADVRIQGGNDTDRILNHLNAALLVYGDAQNTLLCQGLDGVLQPKQALNEALGDDRLHNVELQLTGLGSKAYGCVVTYNLEANLIYNLGDNRVNLTWHDR